MFKSLFERVGKMFAFHIAQDHLAELEAVSLIRSTDRAILLNQKAAEAEAHGLTEQASRLRLSAEAPDGLGTLDRFQSWLEDGAPTITLQPPVSTQPALSVNTDATVKKARTSRRVTSNRR